MIVNFTKTKEMVFGPPSITSNLPPVSASSYQIQRASEAKLLKLLGIHNDSNLPWHTHVEAVVSKATQRLYFLKQLKRVGFPTPRCFISIFHSSVLSWNMQSLFGHLLTKTQDR